MNSKIYFDKEWSQHLYNWICTKKEDRFIIIPHINISTSLIELFRNPENNSENDIENFDAFLGRNKRITETFIINNSNISWDLYDILLYNINISLNFILKNYNILIKNQLIINIIGRILSNYYTIEDDMIKKYPHIKWDNIFLARKKKIRDRFWSIKLEKEYIEEIESELNDLKESFIKRWHSAYVIQRAWKHKYYNSEKAICNLIKKFEETLHIL